MISAILKAVFYGFKLAAIATIFYFVGTVFFFALCLIAINHGYKNCVQNNDISTKIEPTRPLLLPPAKEHTHRNQTIENEVSTTPLSTEIILDHHLSKQPTWQQKIIEEIKKNGELPTKYQLKAEAQEASKPIEALAISGMDTASYRDTKPRSNQLTSSIICWQAINKTAALLHEMKATEMKAIASELGIKGYGKMSKIQLLLAITEAYYKASVTPKTQNTKKKKTKTKPITDNLTARNSLEKMTKSELQQACKQQKLKGYSKLSKPKLISLLSA
jgi:hypothetical protein